MNRSINNHTNIDNKKTRKEQQHPRHLHHHPRHQQEIKERDQKAEEKEQKKTHTTSNHANNQLTITTISSARTTKENLQKCSTPRYNTAETYGRRRCAKEISV
jgi:hypothetical protein